MAIITSTINEGRETEVKNRLIAGITDVCVKELKAKRPYIIISAFVIGMLLTSPDIISQILLAVPILILFELGVEVIKVLTCKVKVPAQATKLLL